MEKPLEGKPPTWRNDFGPGSNDDINRAALQLDTQFQYYPMATGYSHLMALILSDAAEARARKAPVDPQMLEGKRVLYEGGSHRRRTLITARLSNADIRWSVINNWTIMVPPSKYEEATAILKELGIT